MLYTALTGECPNLTTVYQSVTHNGVTNFKCSRMENVIQVIKRMMVY